MGSRLRPNGQPPLPFQGLGGTLQRFISNGPQKYIGLLQR